MSNAVRDTTRDILAGAATREPDSTDAAWRALTAAGLHTIAVPETIGGSGGTLDDACAAVHAAAAAAAGVPLAEALFGAGPVLTELGAAIPAGLVAATAFAAGSTLTATESGDGWLLDGTVRRVPFGRQADHVAIVTRTAGGGLLTVQPLTGVEITPGTNLAGEPRDDLILTSLEVDPAASALVPAEQIERLLRLAALARAVQISGALDETVAIAVRYANERTQFGRTISRFQAVGHQLALMVGAATVTSAAVDSAMRMLGTGDEALAIAATKARASESAGSVARAAHQVFGALGFTQEHHLHRLTRRLWSWRDECGTGDEWQLRLGGHAVAARTTGLWPLLSGVDGSSTQAEDD